MPSYLPLVRRFLLVGVVTLSCTVNVAFAQSEPARSVPMLLEAETFTADPVNPPMTAGYDIEALGGRFISMPSGTEATLPRRNALKQITLPAGTYFLWARVAGLTSQTDALYIGIDNSFDRVFPTAPGPYQWVRVETADGSGAHAFTFAAAGDHTIQVGYGEIGAKLDAVYLTNDQNDVPSFAPSTGLLVEAESMTLEPASQMAVGSGDDLALGRQYLTTSAPTSTTPVRRASVQVQLPVGSYYLWARLGGASMDNDALYVGIDSSFARVFPAPSAPYGWAKVATGLSSTSFQFSITTAGTHVIQVGEGETGARLDAVYLTDSATDVPDVRPMRRVIEAESFVLEPTPMKVGTEAAANGGQYISVTSGTDSTNPIAEARATVHVPTGGGTYYLWARVKGLTGDSDAIYVGFDNTFRRVFPSNPGAYEWVRAEAATGPEFSLIAGPHDIVAGHGEIGARLDAVYITDDVNDAPIPTAPPSTQAYEGWGAVATGGTGHPVVQVTNLSGGTGAGSLRAALASGNRRIIFTVGGTINLTGNAVVGGNNVTIDGLSAPSPGITLRGGIFIVDGRQNVIVQGLRVRDTSEDAIKIIRSSRVMVHKCSVSGFVDGGIDITEGSFNVTVQWSLLGPSNNPNKHNFQMLVGINQPYNISIHHNGFIGGTNRMPQFAPATNTTAAHGPNVNGDVRNNLIWSTLAGSTETGWGTRMRAYAKGNVVNNYYHLPNVSDGNTVNVIENALVFTAGNYSKQGRNLNDNGNRTSAWAAAPVTTTTAELAAQQIVENAGARSDSWGLDDHDQNLLAQITDL